jgi:DegV family protein with EDD domain
MEQVGLVVDSTADLPLDYYEKNQVKMVPLVVRFGEELMKDWIEMTPQEFYPRLKKSSALPKTSQPAVADFIRAYRELEEDGCTHILSVHLSSKVSGTVQSAETARGDVDIPVEILDTGVVSAGVALILDALVKKRAEGWGFQELVEYGKSLIAKSKCLFYLETLEYLHKGGRIGKAQALIGTLLNVKPLLTFEDGLVAPYKKVRGEKRVLPEMVKTLKAEWTGKGKVKLALAQAESMEALNRLREAILSEKDLPVEIIFADLYIGSVIGTYAGPGAVAWFFFEE